MDFVRQLRYRHRLRQLQRAYYAARAGSDGPIIADYLRTLSEAREAELASGDGKRAVSLHIGSGGHYIRRWINIDRDLVPPLDLVADIAASIPFRSGSVDYIHSEDFIEHVDGEAGKRFLREAHRVLKIGGVMRLLTPDLRLVVERVYLRREEPHAGWCERYLEARGPCEALNMHLRMNGEHRFVWDEEHLHEELRAAGFRVKRVRCNASRDPWLRWLDLRDFGLNLFVECRKEAP